VVRRQSLLDHVIGHGRVLFIVIFPHQSTAKEVPEPDDRPNLIITPDEPLIALLPQPKRDLRPRDLIPDILNLPQRIYIRPIMSPTLNLPLHPTLPLFPNLKEDFQIIRTPIRNISTKVPLCFHVLNRH
jgi:hypothetical protein